MLYLLRLMCTEKTKEVAVGEEFSSPQLPLSIYEEDSKKLTVQEREQIKRTLNKRVEREEQLRQTNSYNSIMEQEITNSNLKKHINSNSLVNNTNDYFYTSIPTKRYKSK